MRWAQPQGACVLRQRSEKLRSLGRGWLKSRANRVESKTGTRARSRSVVQELAWEQTNWKRDKTTGQARRCGPASHIHLSGTGGGAAAAAPWPGAWHQVAGGGANRRRRQ